MFYTKFSGESSDLIGRKVRVVVEYNEGGFPLAAGLVKLVELHWHVIGTPREREEDGEEEEERKVHTPGGH